MNPDDTVASRWFADEVQVHESALRAWLRGKYPALVDPDNLVQESLTRVWRAGQEMKLHSPKAFLFTTASHLALNELRRRSLADIESVGEIADLSVAGEIKPTPESVARSEEIELLTLAIKTLAPRCRQALTLRKLGLSQKEIAAQLRISERAVERHLVKGVRGCARFLAGYGLP